MKITSVVVVMFFTVRVEARCNCIILNLSLIFIVYVLFTASIFHFLLSIFIKLEKNVRSFKLSNPVTLQL